MRVSKYIGMIFDGRWKVIERIDNRFKLENVYNHTIIITSEQTVMRIARGELTVSKLIKNRIRRRGFVR